MGTFHSESDTMGRVLRGQSARPVEFPPGTPFYCDGRRHESTGGQAVRREDPPEVAGGPVLFWLDIVADFREKLIPGGLFVAVVSDADVKTAVPCLCFSWQEWPGEAEVGHVFKSYGPPFSLPADFSPGQEATAVRMEMAVRSGELPATVYADWCEEQGWDARAAELRR